MILANPRSRTKWLSEYLGCGHDLALGCGSVDELVDRVHSVVGTVETSVALGWRLWRELFPSSRFVIVHRVPFEVAESFERLCLAPDWMFIHLQDRALWQCAEEDRNTILVSFESLASRESREVLCDWIGVPWDEERDKGFSDSNIQVDWAVRRSIVESNRDNTLAFTNDLARRLVALEYK